MKIILATDHAGFELKEYIKGILATAGYDVLDATEIFESEDDYTDKIQTGIKKLLETLQKESDAKAIIFGGSGQGEAMVANKFKGIRATVFYGGLPDLQSEIISLSCAHNDANVLSIGARFVSEIEAEKAVLTWIASHEEHVEERHQQRIEKLNQLGA